MKLSQIRSFVAVAERGSVQGAARQMGITQPAVTRSIRDLEHELGAALFERSGTGMTLTAIGEAVLRRAGGIEAEIGRIHDEVAQLTGRHAGTVTAALSFVAHAGLLPKVVARFRRATPDVRLDIREALFTGIEADLGNGAIDFYVGPMPPHEAFPGRLAIEPLFENRRHIFCRRHHPLANATSLADLAGASWVTVPALPAPHDELAIQFARHGLSPPHVAVRAQTMLSMMFLAGSSDLLAALPQQFGQLIGVRNSLVRVPVGETLSSSTICIVKRAGIPLTPAAERLSDLFRRAAIAHAASLPDTVVLAR